MIPAALLLLLLILAALLLSLANDHRPRQSTWAYCPSCKRELVEGNDFLNEDDDGLWVFRCADCGVESRWDFGAPAPICIRWQGQ